MIFRSSGIRRFLNNLLAHAMSVAGTSRATRIIQKYIFITTPPFTSDCSYARQALLSALKIVVFEIQFQREELEQIFQGNNAN